MTREPRSENRSVPPEVAQCLDKICDRFEADWKAGWRPRIEDFLGDMAEPERSALLRDLLLLELQIRHRNNESPKLDRYLSRFPEHRSMIETAFHATPAPPPSPANAEALRTVVTEPVVTQGARDVAAVSSPATSMRRLGRFELVEIVGEGAFGTVYRARDPQLERDVALKVPRTGVIVGDHEVSRFLREAKASAQLRHPHIVAVYEAGRADHTYYIASAFVPGTTLRQALKDDRRLSHAESARLISQLASALHYAHTKGVIHRDVKPANIMLDEQGEPHIMDFGLARRTEGDALRTLEGVRLGTPAYMSPEQAQGQSHSADARTDIWSLGVILYELLTGKRPFDGSETEVLLAVRVKDPDPLRKLDRSIPRDLETICLKCLAKERKDRYASAQRLADELDRWQRGEPIEARPITMAERTWRWTKSNPVLAAVSASFILVLAAVAVGASLMAANLAELQRRTADALTRATEEAQRAEREQERAELETVRARDAQRTVEDTLEAMKKTEADRDVATKTAEAEKKRADVASEESKQAKAQVEDEKTATDEARNSFGYYANVIARVEQAWKSGELDDALATLDECPRNQRSWEWTYLKLLLDQPAKAKFERIENNTRVNCIAFSRDSRMIAIAGAYQGKPLLEVWDSLSGDIQVTIKQTEPALGYRPVTSVALSPDGKTLFSYGKGDLCRQWEIASGEMKSEFSLASGVLFNAEQMDTVLGGAYGSSPARMTFTLYDFASSSAIRGFTERFYQTPNSLASACVSSDGKLLATSLSGRFHDGRTWGGGTVLVWNTKTGQMLLKVLARSGCLSMSFSRAGNFFAAADGPIIRLWETNSWTEIRKFEGHSATVYSLSFHPDGKRLASSSRDGTLRIWDVGTATKILTLSEGDSDTKCTIAFSPDGRFLASGNSTNGTVRIWKSGDLDVTSAAAPKVQQ